MQWFAKSQGVTAPWVRIPYPHPKTKEEMVTKARVTPDQIAELIVSFHEMRKADKSYTLEKLHDRIDNLAGICKSASYWEEVYRNRLSSLESKVQMLQDRHLEIEKDYSSILRRLKKVKA